MSKFSLRPIIRDTEATCAAASVATSLSASLQRFRRRRKQTNDGLLALIEREVLGWPGVSKETHRGSRGGFWVPPATVYKFGRRALGPIHDTGVADLVFPREIHDELI